MLDIRNQRTADQQCVAYSLPLTPYLTPPCCRPSRVLHVCDDYLVVDKPRGLPCMRHESNAAEDVAACTGAALGLTGLEVGGAVGWAPCTASYVGGSLSLPRNMNRGDIMPGGSTSAR